MYYYWSQGAEAQKQASRFHEIATVVSQTSACSKSTIGRQRTINTVVVGCIQKLSCWTNRNCNTDTIHEDISTLASFTNRVDETSVGCSSTVGWQSTTNTEVVDCIHKLSCWTTRNCNTDAIHEAKSTLASFADRVSETSASCRSTVGWQRTTNAEVVSCIPKLSCWANSDCCHCTGNDQNEVTNRLGVSVG